MVDDRLLARVVRHGGSRLLNRAVALVLPVSPHGPRPSIGQRIANAALLRIATSSVPGAIVVGGGLLARHFHLRRKEQAAERAAGDVASDVLAISAPSADLPKPEDRQPSDKTPA